MQEVQVELGKAVPFAQVGFSQHEAEPGLNTVRLVWDVPIFWHWMLLFVVVA